MASLHEPCQRSDGNQMKVAQTEGNKRNNTG